MSANLNFNEEKQQYAVFTTKPAWHGLSQVVSEAQTSEQAIKLACLDYEVQKHPISVLGQEIPGKYGTIRMDTMQPLGVVGERYTVMPNEKAFDFVDEIVGSKEAIFETAGALGNGERIFLTCKLPEKLVVGLDDVADNYFFLTNSHDGSSAIELLFTQVFVCCSNTVREALRSGKRKQSVRHTMNYNSRLLKAADFMGITRARITEMQETFEAFRKVNITDEQLRKFIELAMKPPKEEISEEEYSTKFENKVQTILEYGLTDPAQLIVERKGNLWGAVNAISGYYNNVVEYDTPEDKVKQIMYNTGNRNINKAFNLAMDVMTNNVQLS